MLGAYSQKACDAHLGRKQRPDKDPVGWGLPAGLGSRVPMFCQRGAPEPKASCPEAPHVISQNTTLRVGCSRLNSLSHCPSSIWGLEGLFYSHLTLIWDSAISLTGYSETEAMQ